MLTVKKPDIYSAAVVARGIPQSNDICHSQRAKIQEERLKARNFLSECGYEFDPKYPGLLYINCERD